MKSTNIKKQNYRVSAQDRQQLNGHKGCVVWFTGLSGSGKSTIANAVESLLHKNGIRTYTLDGDNVRHGLNSNVDFSEEGRKENIRRIGEVSKLFVDAGMVVLTAFISPFREDRDTVRKLVPKGQFVEVFVNCPLEICEARDVKGLYKKARAGEIRDFTGIDSPFEPPMDPELEIASDREPVQESSEKIVEYVLKLIKQQ
jgi:adenylylsulfate kinase